MDIVVSLVVILVALKFAEATGGMEFDGWGGAVGASIVCWLSGWLSRPLLAQAFPELPNPESTHGSFVNLAEALGVQLIITMVALLVAWAVVPGAHIRRFVGFFVASTLIVAFGYLTTVL